MANSSNSLRSAGGSSFGLLTPGLRGRTLAVLGFGVSVADTQLLRSGKATVRDIQGWLGHYSLEVTLAYLKGADAESETAQSAANAAFAAFA